MLIRILVLLFLPKTIFFIKSSFLFPRVEWCSLTGQQRASLRQYLGLWGSGTRTEPRLPDPENDQCWARAQQIFALLDSHIFEKEPPENFTRTCSRPRAWNRRAHVVLRTEREILIEVDMLELKRGGNPNFFNHCLLSFYSLSFFCQQLEAGMLSEGGGERTDHLHQPANHSGELIRAARSPQPGCRLGTTSDTTPAPLPPTARRQRASMLLLTVGCSRLRCPHLEVHLRL